MKTKAILATTAAVFALISSGAGGISWVVDRLDNLVTKTELQLVHLDIIISMDEQTLAELDYQLDSGMDNDDLPLDKREWLSALIYNADDKEKGK